MDNEEIKKIYLELKKVYSNDLVKTIEKECLFRLGICFGTDVFCNFNETIVSVVGISQMLLFLKKINNFTTENWRFEIENHPFYQNIMTEYKECNKRIADSFARKQNLHPVFLAGMYRYLLENGFFSYEHQFKAIKNQICSSGLDQGLEVICGGYAVCRHISYHFTKILEELEFTSSILNISINSKLDILSPSLSFGYASDDVIKKVLTTMKQRSYKEKVKETIRFIIGNHMINSFSYNNKSYYLDLTNELAFKNKNNKHLELYNAANLLNKGYKKSDYTVPIHYFTKKVFNIDESLVNEILKFNSATYEEIENEYNNGKIYALENKLKFESMYDKNSDSYKKILSDVIKFQDVLVDVKVLKKNK